MAFPWVMPPAAAQEQPLLPMEAVDHSGDSTSSASLLEDSECPKNWQNRSFNVCLGLLNNINTKNTSNQEWRGRLEINARNVPRLMKEGLHFTAANAKRRRGYIYCFESPIQNDDPESTRYPLIPGRRWRLVDSSSASGEPQWVANLLIFGRDILAVEKFKVEDLSLGNVYMAQAWDWEEQLIYGFYANEPEKNFNLITYDKPLEGWWPWPKREEQPRAINLGETNKTEKSTNTKAESVKDMSCQCSSEEAITLLDAELSFFPISISSL